jgi:hypothetical protein
MLSVLPLNSRVNVIAWAWTACSVNGVDALQCPRCNSGRLRPIAVITDDEIVSRILSHLHLPVSPELLADECTVVVDLTDQPTAGWVLGADPDPPEFEAAARGPRCAAPRFDVLAFRYRLWYHNSTLGKVRRGNYVLLYWKGDHGPRHVHVYKDGKLVLKWNLDDNQPMKGKPTARVLQEYCNSSLSSNRRVCCEGSTRHSQS